MRLIVQDIVESPMGYHELRCTIKGFEKFEDGWDELAASDFAANLIKRPAYAEFGHPKQERNEPPLQWIARFFQQNEDNICLRIDEIHPEHDLVIVKVWFSGPKADTIKNIEFDLGSRYTTLPASVNHVMFDVIMKESTT